MQKILSFLLFIALVCGLHSAASAKTLRIVTSPSASGTWYVGMGAIGKVLTDSNENLDVTLLPGGGTTNVPRIAAGAAEIGPVTHCIAMASLKGIYPYKKPVTKGVCGIFNLWDRANYQIIRLAGSKVKGLADLKTAKNVNIAVGPSGSTTEIVFRMILQFYGITYDDIRANGGKILTNNFDDVANMAKDGQLDLFCWFGPGEGWFIVEVATSTELEWVSIDKEIGRKVCDSLGMKLGTLPADYYGKRVGENVSVLWDCAEIVVNASLDDDTVYMLTKAISEGKEDIIRANAAWNGMNPAEAWKDLAYPLHPGAERYYREKGYMK